jgi:two-component system LytT family sensor kinase
MTRSKLVPAIAWTLFWLLMVSVAVQDYIKDEDGHAYWQPVLWETSSMLAITALLLVQRHFTHRHQRLIGTPRRWFLHQLAWLPLYWLAFTPIAFGIRHAVYALLGQQYQHAPWGQTFFYESLKITVFFGLFMLIEFGVLSYYELLEEKLRAEKANALLRQAQLQRLTQQMQPHFLFNALNTISSLMHSDVDKADATLVQLAEVLRTTLDVSERHEAPLATELRLVRGYAAIMEERYADRVAIAWQVDDRALACQVPVMSIQPLLENIFKHTVELRRLPTRIRITAALDGGHLLVRLDDDSGTLRPADPGRGGGIGLANLRERLDVMYNGAASVALSQLSPAGVRAEMRLPCAC